MEKQKENLRKLAHGLDHGMGGIMLNVETLSDIREELGRVRIDMDNTNQASVENVRLQFRECHHYIRLLDSLLYYAVEDLKVNVEKADKLKSELFDIVVKKGDVENDGFLHL